jgi:fatty-acyl-CoA synthase
LRDELGACGRTFWTTSDTEVYDMSHRALEIEPSSTVWDHWRRHAAVTPNRDAIIHLESGEEPYHWSWGELMRASSTVAGKLAERGVRAGDVCALVIRHHRHFYPTYLAVSSLGALPSVLAYPNSRLHPDKFREGLRGMASRSGLDHVLTEHELTETIEPLVAGQDSTIKDILYPLDWLEDSSTWENEIVEHPPTDADAPCLLQHSSGTTGLQKPVVLSHRAVLEHLARYAESISLGPKDTIVSWLPLYHDMGLVAAFYLPLVCGVPLVQISPMEWVSSPVMLLSALAGHRGTISWLPNFAYNFMAERIREEDLVGIRLDHLRMLVNCSEPVRAESHDKFYKRFADLGLRRGSLGACYAMAETTFAVTQTAPGREAKRVKLDRSELAMGKATVVSDDGIGTTRVSSGVPIEGCSIRILDDEGKEVEHGGVGEISISSVSMFDGYRNYPEKTAEVMRDGWYQSGDLGFVRGGELFVIGRKKDVMIIAGNNVYPEDVEDAVGKVPGVIPGRVVAFGAEDESLGTEVLCVIAESEEAADDRRKALRIAILRAGMAIDVTISRVYVVPPRWMIKSSSGKPARSTNRARALELPANR